MDALTAFQGPLIKEFYGYDYPPLSDSRITIQDFLENSGQIQVPLFMGQSKMLKFLCQHGSLRIIIHPTDDKENLVKQLMATINSIYVLISVYDFSGTPLKIYWANGYSILAHEITSNKNLIDQLMMCGNWIY